MAGHKKVKEFLDEVWETHKRKNSDYSKADVEEDGNPLSNFYKSEQLGVDALSGCLVRLTDKYERVANLHKKSKQGKDRGVKDEPFEDALKDLAGYAAIAYAIYIDKKDNSAVDSTEPAPDVVEVDDNASENFSRDKNLYREGKLVEHVSDRFAGAWKIVGEGENEIKAVAFNDTDKTNYEDAVLTFDKEDVVLI